MVSKTSRATATIVAARLFVGSLIAWSIPANPPPELAMLRVVTMMDVCMCCYMFD